MLRALTTLPIALLLGFTPVFSVAIVDEPSHIGDSQEVSWVENTYIEAGNSSQYVNTKSSQSVTMRQTPTLSHSTSSVASIYELNDIPVQSNRDFFKVGIDVSYHNKEINWKAVKDSGVDFALIRTSYGWEEWDNQTDVRLKENIAGAKAAGIPIGAYHCSYARNRKEANLEADFFIDRLKWTQWEYPVFVDMEMQTQRNLTNAQRTEVLLTFLYRLKKAGYYTGYYTNLNWTRHMLDMNRLRRYDLWIAQWNKACHCTHPYGVWQFTSEGVVPGIEGDVDMNLCYVDYPSIIKNAHLNGF